MNGRRSNGEEIREFLIDRFHAEVGDVPRLARRRFGITRNALNRHLEALEEAGILRHAIEGTKSQWCLVEDEHIIELRLADHGDEEIVYREQVESRITSIPENVARICYYAFTEMYNNALDHSEGISATVQVTLRPREVFLMVRDDGVGIFRKIARRCGFEDDRHSILELAKGKMTTDPDRHTGEGIFFTSRMCDNFFILSGNLKFLSGANNREGWLVPSKDDQRVGTTVYMGVDTRTDRTPKGVFEMFSSPNAEGTMDFSRTHVPLVLAEHGPDSLVSRSQAKRILARFERFKEVMLDFEGVDSIGPSFADEVFRVFANAHPDVEVLWLNANPAVTGMIKRAVGNRSVAKRIT